MNKNLIIGAVALTLIGGGAYLYFRNKSNQKKLLGGTLGSPLTQGQIDSTQASLIASQGSPQGGTTLTSPAQVAQVIDNLAKAKEIASKVPSIRKMFQPIDTSVNCKGFISGVSQMAICSKNRMIEATNAKYQKQIDDLLSELTKLGYTELNGQPVKIG